METVLQSSWSAVLHHLLQSSSKFFKLLRETIILPPMTVSYLLNIIKPIRHFWNHGFYGTIPYSAWRMDWEKGERDVDLKKVIFERKAKQLYNRGMQLMKERSQRTDKRTLGHIPERRSLWNNGRALETKYHLKSMSKLQKEKTCS